MTAAVVTFSLGRTSAARERCAEKLGFARGRVLRRRNSTDAVGDPKELPDVVWECEYPTIDARELESKALAATAEFQAVQKQMSTLIRRFERGTYEVEEPGLVL